MKKKNNRFFVLIVRVFASLVRQSQCQPMSAMMARDRELWSLSSPDIYDNNGFKICKKVRSMQVFCLFTLQACRALNWFKCRSMEMVANICCADANIAWIMQELAYDAIHAVLSQAMPAHSSAQALSELVRTLPECLPESDLGWIFCSYILITVLCNSERVRDQTRRPGLCHWLRSLSHSSPHSLPFLQHFYKLCLILFKTRLDCGFKFTAYWKSWMTRVWPMNEANEALLWLCHCSSALFCFGLLIDSQTHRSIEDSTNYFDWLDSRAQFVWNALNAVFAVCLPILCHSLAESRRPRKPYEK